MSEWLSKLKTKTSPSSSKSPLIESVSKESSSYEESEDWGEDIEGIEEELDLPKKQNQKKETISSQSIQSFRQNLVPTSTPSSSKKAKTSKMSEEYAPSPYQSTLKKKNSISSQRILEKTTISEDISSPEPDIEEIESEESQEILPSFHRKRKISEESEISDERSPNLVEDIEDIQEDEEMSESESKKYLQPSQLFEKTVEEIADDSFSKKLRQFSPLEEEIEEDKTVFIPSKYSQKEALEEIDELPDDNEEMQSEKKNISSLFLSPFKAKKKQVFPTTPGESTSRKWLDSFSVTHDTQTLPEDLKNPTSRKKFVKGGHAERTARMIQRQKIQAMRSDEIVGFVDLIAMQIKNEASAVLVFCRSLQNTNIQCNDFVEVVLSVERVNQGLEITPGTCIRIQPPWTQLEYGGMMIILCTHCTTVDIISQQYDHIDLEKSDQEKITLQIGLSDLESNFPCQKVEKDSSEKVSKTAKILSSYSPSIDFIASVTFTSFHDSARNPSQDTNPNLCQRSFVEHLIKRVKSRSSKESEPLVVELRNEETEFYLELFDYDNTDWRKVLENSKGKSFLFQNFKVLRVFWKRIILSPTFTSKISNI